MMRTRMSRTGQTTLAPCRRESLDLCMLPMSSFWPVSNRKTDQQCELQLNFECESERPVPCFGERSFEWCPALFLPERLSSIAEEKDYLGLREFCPAMSVAPNCHKERRKCSSRADDTLRNPHCEAAEYALVRGAVRSSQLTVQACCGPESVSFILFT